MISLQQVKSFTRKSPEQRGETARFMVRTWLAKLPYAPYRVRLKISEHEQVKFWWSYIPASFHADRTIFDYWGDDIGDLRLIWRLLQPGMTFLDLGAYHGVYSVVAAKRVALNGRVIAFEPSPREQRRLRLHLRYNRLKSAVAEPFALAAENGKAPMLIVVKGYTSMNSLRPPATSYPTQQIAVDTTALDEYLSRKAIEKVDVAKIDVEGAEMEVFRGAERFLGRMRPILICELNDQVTRPWGYPARQIACHLQTNGYQWFDIRADGTLLHHRLTTEYPNAVNYLAVPVEAVNRVRGFLA
jgi:FkbM family methyltransferase